MLRNILDGYRGVFDFHGRVRRKVYRHFAVFHAALSYLVFRPLLHWGSGMLRLHGTTTITPGTIDTITTGVFILVFWLPILAILVRRVHDTNSSGWYILFPGFLFIPPIAVVAAFIKPVPAEGGANRFGPDPRSPDIEQIKQIFE